MKYHFPKLPLFLSVVLLASSCAVFFLLHAKIKNNQVASEQMMTEWQTEARRRGKIEALEQAVAAVEQERAQLETHFAQSSDVVPFLDMFETLATDVGAKAEVLLLDLSKDNTGLIVQIKAGGSFESIYKFLTLLENSPYELEFTSMDLQSGNSGNPTSANSQWSMTLGMKLKSFIQ